MANESRISQPCPHCKTVQYFTTESLGKGTECTACGLKYFGPKTINDDGVKVVPADAPPVSSPTPLAAIPAHVLHDSPEEYLGRLRKQTRFGAARGMMRALALLCGIGVLLLGLASFAGMAATFGVGGLGGGAVSLGATFLLEVIIVAAYQFSVVILDIADALIDIGRKTR